MKKFFSFIALAALLPLLVCAADAQTSKGIQVLRADGNDECTYTLIRNTGFNYEVPDVSRDHATAPFRHIGQVYDNNLHAYSFVFFIHALIDDDRGISSITNRQRVEIKTDNGSPESLTAKEGETLKMRWKMKLPEGFKTTTKFCHLHQLKGIDNAAGTADVSTPLITLTAYTSNGSQKLQLRYFNRSTNEITAKKTIGLSDVIGQWVEVEEAVTFGTNQVKNDNGRYKITVTRLSDHKELLTWTKNSDIDLWQTDCTAMRPKWGIYRYIGEDRSIESQLRDEEVRFADFCIEKEMATDITPISSQKTCINIIFDLQGRRVGTAHKMGGIYIKNGKKFIIKT